MILPDFVLPFRINQCWNYSGMDDLDHCLDKNHFKSYPYTVSYQYNSRGYRDQEWPNNMQELKDSIWCLGDSFTVGLGSPREHTWVYQVENITNTRTINVSMDGASNQWISRRAIQILKEISPKLLIIQWSYVHRFESDDDTLSDEERRLHMNIDNFYDADKLQEIFLDLVKQVELARQNTTIIHSFIPGFKVDLATDVVWNNIKGESWPDCPKNLSEFQRLDRMVVYELRTTFKAYDTFKNHFEREEKLQVGLLNNIMYIPEIVRLDRARDGNHYDLLTAQKFARDVGQLLS